MTVLHCLSSGRGKKEFRFCNSLILNTMGKLSHTVELQPRRELLGNPLQHFSQKVVLFSVSAQPDSALGGDSMKSIAL
jgi:hypothetical protein